MTKPKNIKRQEYYLFLVDSMIGILQDLLKLQQQNYEPYKEEQTKKAIRALLNIRGIKNLKAFNRV